MDNLLVNDYNNLLTNLEFWKMLNGEKLLIYQEDTLMFKNNMNNNFQKILKYTING